MKYKAIVFDYGGVLVVNGLDSSANLMDNIGEILGVSGEEFKQEYFNHNYISNVEGKPWIDACLSAVRSFDDSPETEVKIRKINSDFNNSKKLNSELIDLIKRLKESEYIIAILSNYTTELREILKEQKIYEFFEHVFVSGEIGAQKPDPRAFSIVCDKLGITPAEMIFIDDSQKSLETAGEIGYTPILFESNEQLIGSFKKLGVL